METINDLGHYTFPAMLANSVKKFGECNACTLVGGKPLTYTQLNEKVIFSAKFLTLLGAKQGTKIAILANGCPEWVALYFAIVNYGRIAVPLLPDFSLVEIETICAHCEPEIMVLSEAQYKRLAQKLENLEKLPATIIQLEDFKIIKKEGKIYSDSPADETENNQKKSVIPAKIEDEKIRQTALPEITVNEDDTASIIYTSGTTGRSKGVELSHKNLVWNAVQGQYCHRVNKMDRCLSFLPIAHVYEFTIDFTMQLMNGACIYYLGKPPVISALLPAFKSVQPTIVCAVPLIVEKIYKNKVLPEFTKSKLLRTLYKIRPFQILLHRVAASKLKKTFGGHLVFFGIGGAKIDYKVERFLKDGKFPYAVGYGLTETSPLLAAAGVPLTWPGTIGPVVNGVDLKILDPDPKTGIGEVVVKGPNIMKGYYKESEMTAAAFTTKDDSLGEGWFKTGDLGVIKKIHGVERLALKGRSKTMILGSAGENIYPEDIEFVLNQHPLVNESLVVEDDKGLVALLSLDEDKIKEEIKKRLESLNLAKEQFIRDMAYKREEILSEIQFFVNSKVNKSSKINRIQEVKEFEKTATQKIKRYIYDLRSKVGKK